MGGQAGDVAEEEAGHRAAVQADSQAEGKGEETQVGAGGEDVLRRVPASSDTVAETGKGYPVNRLRPTRRSGRGIMRSASPRRYPRPSQLTEVTLPQGLTGWCWR